MRLVKRVYQGSGGNSFQDLEMEINVKWNAEEIKKVPCSVKNAIEAVIRIDQQAFKQNVNYAFYKDSKGRPCLTVSERAKFTFGQSLSEKLLDIWREYLGLVTDCISDNILNHCDCHDFGSERTFLRRMELIDALLRINFYRDNFWRYRAKWSVESFVNEVHEPNNVVGFPFEVEKTESAVR